ncbi:hypothetical protein Tco_0390073 [Tanacetum coccineum]
MVYCTRTSDILASSSEFPLDNILLPHPRFIDEELLLFANGGDFLWIDFNRTHIDRFTSGSSSSHSSLDHSSSRHSISGNSLPGHSSPETTIADSYTPLRFVHPPLARTPRCSEAYLRWRSTPLVYHVSTGRNPSSSSAGILFLSHCWTIAKRCRSPATTVTYLPSTRVLVPSRDDLLLPHKRFKDSISPEDIVEEDN